MRGHENVWKRLLVHASGFNLGLAMRTLFGVGTPRALQDRAVALLVLRLLRNLVCDWIPPISRQTHPAAALRYSANELIRYA